jgi:hypothetical protein
VEPLDVGRVSMPLTQTVIVDGKQFHHSICRKDFGNRSLTNHVCIYTRERAHHCPTYRK